jgi:hypothetical protein
MYAFSFCSFASNLASALHSIHIKKKSEEVRSKYAEELETTWRTCVHEDYEGPRVHMATVEMMAREDAFKVADSDSLRSVLAALGEDIDGVEVDSETSEPGHARIWHHDQWQVGTDTRPTPSMRMTSSQRNSSINARE